MKRYMVAIKVITEAGQICDGNQGFDTEEPLSQIVLEAVKEKYCQAVTARGNLCHADKAVIYAVIPLEA
jgi:hypothetical protein